MEIEVVKKIIEQHLKGFPTKVRQIKKSELYYENKNDILRQRSVAEKKYLEKNPDNPLRNADNRVSHAWHSLLVNQKASYTMSIPPTFDVDDEHLNDEIEKLLGDQYPKVAKDLSINASNAGVSWLHVWKDEEYKNFFRYAIVDSKQIIPIYSKRLSNQLEGLLRVFEDYDEAGEAIVIYEYWNDKECSTFYKKKKDKLEEGLGSYDSFELLDVGTGEIVGTTNVFRHDWGRIPFIPFRNNPIEQADLENYKHLIDVYDKVYSGFVNDLDDIQEIIFVLTNYGGEDKQEFLNDLKRYKMVKLDADADEQGKFETMAIEIPVEARTKILEITREAIFVLGQGVDPQKNIGQNNSGQALKFMYSLLELKASMLETEFALAFAELIRFILIYSGADPDVRINQNWTRTSISNDLEEADIVAKLATVSSEESIAKRNPIVEDWQTEIENLKKEREDDYRASEDYRNNDPNKKDVIDDDEEE